LTEPHPSRPGSSLFAQTADEEPAKQTNLTSDSFADWLFEPDTAKDFMAVPDTAGGRSENRKTHGAPTDYLLDYGNTFPGDELTPRDQLDGIKTEQKDLLQQSALIHRAQAHEKREEQAAGQPRYMNHHRSLMNSLHPDPPTTSTEPSKYESDFLLATPPSYHHRIPGMVNIDDENVIVVNAQSTSFTPGTFDADYFPPMMSPSMINKPKDRPYIPETAQQVHREQKLDRTVSDIYQDELYNPPMGPPAPSSQIPRPKKSQDTLERDDHAAD